MERYENIVKIEEMRKLADINQYKKAMKILETIDTGKIKALTGLSIIADVYMQNQRYDEAMEILTRIYGKTKTRRVLYQLVDLSIKRGNAKEAEEYLEKYVKVAPGDPSRYIFQYCIDKLYGEPYEVLISTLEQLKEYEYHEMWAYELAKLYHKAGMKDKCVRECSDIILWFGEGVYVEKAKLLKGYYVGEINPLHMLKANEKKEATEKLGLDKTKDYSEMKSHIEHYLNNENSKAGQQDNSTAGVQEVHNLSRQGKAASWEEQSDETEKIPEGVFDETSIYSTDNQEQEETLSAAPMDQADYEEDPVINDPELEAFFKRIARKIERELQGREKAEKSSDVESQAAKVNAKEDSKTASYREMEAAEEKEAFKNENQDNKESDSLAGYTWADNQSEEMYTEESYTEDKNHWNQTYTESEMEESNEIYSMDEYRPGELDSVFEEAGMSYKKLFGYLVHMEFTAKQIEECLKRVLSDYTRFNHLIITGDKKSGKTTLAKKMTKALYGLNRIHADRVAKISGLKLNGISLANKKDKLMNSSLVIEDAGEMSMETVEQLLALIQDLNEKLYVILEDNEDSIYRLLENNPKLKEVFGCKISLPEYTTRDFIGFAISYIQNNDYELSPDIRRAFELEIERIISFTKAEDRLEAVMELAKKTKTSAEERYKALLSDMINARELSPEDLLYISKEDFLPEE